MSESRATDGARARALAFAALVACMFVSSTSARADAIKPSHVEAVEATADGRIWIRLDNPPACTGTQLLKVAKEHPSFNAILSLATAALLSNKQIGANYNSADCTVIDLTLVRGS